VNRVGYLYVKLHSLKYNQQDATLYNILYYCQCSTCFRRFLRPSSGAQNCTHSIWYMSNLCLLLLLAVAANTGLTWENTLTMHGPMNVKRKLIFHWVRRTTYIDPYSRFYVSRIILECQFEVQDAGIAFTFYLFVMSVWKRETEAKRLFAGNFPLRTKRQPNKEIKRCGVLQEQAWKVSRETKVRFLRFWNRTPLLLI
jgi:hypothetical protein